MKKKLDTRFPAPRIKKIMQADEEVGKIAMAVPLLVSKALELFLQDLCDRTYEVTLNKGAKIVSSLHLKQCVQSFNVFDFLKDTVSKVTDLGGSDAATEDKSAVKRRKISETEEYGNCDEPKYVVMQETGHASGNSRGRGRGRGRGWGRGSSVTQRESIMQYKKPENILEISYQNGGIADSKTITEKDSDQPVRNFDLNVDLNEDCDSTPTFAGNPSESKPTLDMKHGEVHGWSLDNMERMAIDPAQLVSLSGGHMGDDVDEDYDEDY